MHHPANKTYGWELNIDLYDCDLKTISNSKRIKDFVGELCDKILKVKRSGKLILKRYGKVHLFGFSFMQLIDASSIIGHFSELWKSAYIDIFSCKKFDNKKVVKFTEEFFRAKKVVSRFVVRK